MWEIPHISPAHLSDFRRVMREKKAWSGIEEVITAPTRNQSSILEADQREPLEILGISGHKGFGKSLISLLHISPISGG